MTLFPRKWKSCEDMRNHTTNNTNSRLFGSEEMNRVLEENVFLKNSADLQESKLTELHSIIAELRKQLSEFQSSRIDEEEEQELLSEEEEESYFEDGILCGSGAGGDELDRSENEESGPANIDGVENWEKANNGMVGQLNENKLTRILAHLQTIQMEHNQIKASLAEREGELEKARMSLREMKVEKDGLARKIHHLQQQQQQHNNISTTNHHKHLPQQQQHCRFASRRKLSTSHTQQQSPNITSIASLLNSSLIVEKLVNLNEAAALGELRCCSREELELVLEKEGIKADKLQNEVEFLLGRLSEAKATNESLVSVVGRVESWGMGWKVVAERSDSTIELYDILVALLESELGLLLANVKAAGIGNCDEIKENSSCDVESLLRRAEFNKDTAMGAAYRVLGWGREKTVGPRTLEHQIRSLIISLKTTSAKLTSTIPEYDFNMNQEIEVHHGNHNNHSRMDLETAVLMQELLSCREDKAELKMRLACVERERDFLVSQVGSWLMGQDSLNSGGSEAELNNNNTKVLPTNDLHTYSLLHDSNKTLLKTLDDTKTKYRERVKLLEERILLMVGK